MTRQTSIEAFKKIRESGLLSRERFRVFATIFAMGSCTSGEAFESIVKRNQGANSRNGRVSSLSQSRARFTELRDLGVIEEIDVRPCKVTGRNCIVWQPTGNLPGQLPRRQTKLAEAEERIQNLEADNKRLRAELEKRPAQGRLL